ncbi:MAG TPA: cytochrome c oxidase subunit 3 family protein [Blastocatellia bacterium]|nr:cytochrome c oxidase subunit 3 family protein [Blastocatellia bacterium]
MSEREFVIAEQFDDAEQQREAGALGMWVFLATEILFFGGLFATYTVYRDMNPVIFDRASQTLDIGWGTINTIVLILSSFTMAMAVYSSQTGRRRLLPFFLICTIILGCAFLGIKGLEYYHKYVLHHIPGHGFQLGPELAGLDEGKTQIFFALYFAMTGLHAVHMIIGISVITVLLVMALRGRFTPQYHTPVEVSGLYWHFVDIIWIFLYPLLYLMGLHLPH